MSRKHPAPSRKRRAIRWAAALAVLLVLNTVLGLYYLFPGQTLAYLETRYSMTNMETVHSAWDGLRRLYLRRGDGGLYYTALEFIPWIGWDYSAFVPLSAQDTPPLWGATVHCEDRDARVTLFGFVPEGAEPPVFSIRTTMYNSNGAAVSEAETDRFTPQANIPGEGGSYCLTVLHYPSPNFSSIDIYVQQMDGTWEELDRQSKSSRGP